MTRTLKFRGIATEDSPAMTAWTEHTIETAQGARCRCASIGKRCRRGAGRAASARRRLHRRLGRGERTAARAARPGRRGRGLGRLSAGAGAPFPDALDAPVRCADRAAALLRRNGRARRSAVFVAGEEAGGNLAAGARPDGARPARAALAGQILLSPMLDPVHGDLLGARAPRPARSAAHGPTAGTISRLARQGRASLCRAGELQRGSPASRPRWC